MGLLHTPRAVHAPAPAILPLGAMEMAGHMTSSQHVILSASSEHVAQAHSMAAALSLIDVPTGHCRVLHLALPWQLEQMHGLSPLHSTARVASRGPWDEAQLVAEDVGGGAVLFVWAITISNSLDRTVWTPELVYSFLVPSQWCCQKEFL